MKRMIPVIAGLALFGSGYLVGQAHGPKSLTAAPATSYGADYCTYRITTHYLSGGGSYTALTAIVAEWDTYFKEWRSVSDFTATSAVGSFSCKRDW